MITIDFSLRPVKDKTGEVILLIPEGRDIAENRLNSLVKDLERSNQELDEFATVVSHDLISPLQKQLLVLELVKEEYADCLSESGLSYFERIIGYNSPMDNLLCSLLAYVRTTTKAQLFTSVDLNDLIENVLDDLKPEIESLQANIEVSQLPTIQGDRLQLNQLFLNLFQNAFKFCSRDRVLEINIKYCWEKDWHQITVLDNGIGFEPEQQSKIFTPFHRLHSQSKYKGTGLGLAICNKVVERHQGKITASSQLDRGAAFTICFPTIESAGVASLSSGEGRLGD